MQQGCDEDEDGGLLDGGGVGCVEEVEECVHCVGGGEEVSAGWVEEEDALQ